MRVTRILVFGLDSIIVDRLGISRSAFLQSCRDTDSSLTNLRFFFKELRALVSPVF